jgi:hypothetical protein
LNCFKEGNNATQLIYWKTCFSVSTVKLKREEKEKNREHGKTAVFYIILHKDHQRTLILILNNKFLNSSQIYFF